MTTKEPEAEHVALNLSAHDWFFVTLLVVALLAVVPWLNLRPETPVVERDYRLPYALSTRYDLYRRFITLAADQFPTVLVGDSVVWGQCADRDETLSHYLNAMTEQPRFINCGLDGMHPIALSQLLEHHAVALQKKDVILQMNPLWLMAAPGSAPEDRSDLLLNRPGLVPRLALDSSGTIQERIEGTIARALHSSTLDQWNDWIENSRVDFLAWTLDHPYENPRRAITAGLPPSEAHPTRKIPWEGTEGAKLDAAWSDLDRSTQWRAFERTLDLLQARHNRILVLIGPMNEHMMSARMRETYEPLKRQIETKIVARGIACYTASVLRTDCYTDICHPTGAGYRELARELLRSQSAWLRGTPSR